MIQISGMPWQDNDSWEKDGTDRKILEALKKTSVIYTFASERELFFEVKSRKNIIASAKEMDGGEASFATFKNAQCNPEYWQLTAAGGFLLKRHAKPGAAIRDIFNNSRFYKYECATACVINFYNGLLMTMGEASFNDLFPRLYLYSWHTDDDLGLASKFINHYIPGDVVYFNNPDVEPTTPWFRGVNAIAMGDDSFFGHGFSIRTEDQMIEGLNSKRKTDGEQSAYLTSLITRPTFQPLARFSAGRLVHKTTPFIVHHNKTSVSFRHYLYELAYKPNF